MKILLIILIHCPDNWTHFGSHLSNEKNVPGIIEEFKTSKDFDGCKVNMYTFDLEEGERV